MKLTLHQIADCNADCEEEIILRYREMTPEIAMLIERINQETVTLLGKNGEKQYRISPGEIYYLESVDERLFAYTKTQTLQVMMTLTEAEKLLSESVKRRMHDGAYHGIVSYDEGLWEQKGYL